MTRYVVIVPAGIADPPGHCPACGGILDDSGCRIGWGRWVRPEAARRTGIGRVVEVFCRGVPTAPVVACPCCADHA